MVEHYADDITVEDVASSAALNSKYATTLFKRSLGITILAFLTQYRLAHAQRLLATTNEKVTTVAFESGFSSVRRLYELFRDTYGKSPSEYRSEFL